MEQLQLSYRDWLAEQKASILNLVKTTFSQRGRRVSCIDLERVSTAFDIAAECHDENDIRDMWELYLNHPLAVAMILLTEFPDTNIEQILIAILHDTGEKDIAFISIIAQQLSKALADSVRAISKRELHEYVDELPETHRYLFHSDTIIAHDIPLHAPHIVLNQEQLDTIRHGRELLKKELKDERNHEYFSGLSELDDDELSVKLADRLHNLRTLRGCSLKKQQSTIESTRKYFLPVAKKRNPRACDLLLRELEIADEALAIAILAQTKTNNQAKIQVLMGQIS